MNVSKEFMATHISNKKKRLRKLNKKLELDRLTLTKKEEEEEEDDDGEDDDGDDDEKEEDEEEEEEEGLIEIITRDDAPKKVELDQLINELIENQAIMEQKIDTIQVSLSDMVSLLKKSHWV